MPHPLGSVKDSTLNVMEPSLYVTPDVSLSRNATTSSTGSHSHGPCSMFAAAHADMLTIRWYAGGTGPPD